MYSKINKALILFTTMVLVSCGQGEVNNETGVAPAPIVEQVQPASQGAAPTAIPFAIFPSQVRELASAEVIARGETVYESLCRACHGADLRGGDQGGPNLLRSQTVLNDQHGELIGEVIQNGLSNPGMPEMPPLQVAADDRVAVAEFIHSIWAQQSGQGGPPRGESIELNIVVGDAAAGEAYFNQQCTGCHSVTGDLQGIASAIVDPENLQNSWVAGRRWGAPNPNADPARSQVRVAVTLNNGEVISGVLGRRDDFVISLTTDTGQYRSFTLHRNAQSQVASIDIQDPKLRHRQLLSELTDDIMHDVTAYLVTLR